MLLNSEQPHDGPGPSWEVIQLDENELYKPSQHVQNTGDTKTLTLIIEDLTTNFKEQLQELATCYKVSPNALSQQAAGKLCNLQCSHGKPLTSTPKAAIDPPNSGDSMGAEESIGFQDYKGTQGTSPVLAVPAEVQRVVVEHIVKHGSELHGPTQRKLRVFSGNLPKPSNEVEFGIWRLHARQVINDASLSANQQRQILIDSLLPPALNVALCVGDSASPNQYIQELENAYGSVTDGEELYIQFLETHQSSGEKASDYLRRLHTVLQEVIERKGIPKVNIDAQLMKQFIRGCWDDALIATLHLKESLSDPLMAGICRTKSGGGSFKAIISEPQQHAVPGGLIIFDQVVEVKPVSHNNFKLVVQNASTRDITLPPRAVIAECTAIDWAIPLSSTTPQRKASSATHSLMVVQNEKPVPADSPGYNLNFEGSPISSEFKNHLLNRIYSEVPDAFAKHDLDVGTLAGVMHRIELEPHTPFKERTRRVSPADFEDLKSHLRELLACNIIEESNSPYASPVVLVRKKNGDLRMVVDYRKLNKLTKKDAYPLPRIEETFALLSGSKWFTVLDLKSGYYQLEVEPADRPKTAFTTPFGTWQFRKMPQGLTNSPATFQRTMERVMAGINLQEVIAFLEDLIIFSSTLEEHEQRLMTVLKRIADVGLKLSPAKCRFFQTSVNYLGHVISKQGIQPNPEKVSAIKNWPRPTTVKEVRSFLGFAGYYRRFVRDFSKLVKPLNNLLKGEFASRRKANCCKHKSNSQALEGRWNIECQVAFETIVDKLTSAPVLGFADWKLPYILHTDASTIGLGAALYQVQDGYLGVHQKMTQTLKSLSSECHILIDRVRQSPEEFSVLGAGAMAAVCMRHDVQLLMNTVDEEVLEGGSEIAAVETLLCDEGAVPEDLVEPEPWPGQPSLPSMTPGDWYHLQRADASLYRMIEILENESNKETLDSSNELPEVRLLLRENSKLLLKEGVLYRKIKKLQGEIFHQLVIPQSQRERAFEGVHDEVGHMGFERMIELARARFYWPKMTKYIEEKCRTCERCVRRKARAQKAAKLVNIQVLGPLDPEGHNTKTHSTYVRDLKNRLKQAYRLASENAEKRQLMNKRRWDAKVTAAAIDVGDRVLVRNVGLRRKHKIADRWEPNVYVVVKQPDENIPVYVVREENGDGKERILHRDLLLPCGFLPAKLSDDELESRQRPAIQASQPVTEVRSHAESAEGLDLSYYEESELPKEDKDEQPEAALNPDAPEFFLDNSMSREGNSSVHKTRNSPTKFKEVEEDTEAEVESEESLDMGASRPSRRRVPPAYLSDYEVGYRASCRQQMVSGRSQEIELYSVLSALKKQIEILAQSIREGANRDVRF
ncbi:hypothetical protein MHYP_G00310410 [Metynnis hypsauchen]